MRLFITVVPKYWYKSKREKGKEDKPVNPKWAAILTFTLYYCSIYVWCHPSFYTVSIKLYFDCLSKVFAWFVYVCVRVRLCVCSTCTNRHFNFQVLLLFAHFHFKYSAVKSDISRLCKFMYVGPCCANIQSIPCSRLKF